MKLCTNDNLSFKGSLSKGVTKITLKNALPETIRGLKDGRVSKIDALAFSTMTVSGAGYLVGGVGLLHDFMFEKKEKELAKQSVDSFFMDEKCPSAFRKFEPKQKNIFISNKKRVKKSNPHGGCETIKPKTKFGKIGMNFAKVGVSVAGVAGVFNGISMNLPMLALGEGITTLSAPVIETPIGTGIFGIGLAIINLARVLDSDPKFKIDRETFKKASGTQKAKMLKDNAVLTGKELLKSGAEVAVNTGKLFTPKTKEAQKFFKEKLFSFKPATLVLEERIKDDGKLVLKKIPQANPHLMHTAALGLCAGSLMLIAGELFKKPKTEKAGLGLYGVSNGIDNVALSKWGVEKIASASSASGKATGGAFAVAGGTILAGQGGIDKNWGRGLMWTGIGLIMGGFALERACVIQKSLKKIVPPKLKRQWKIDMNKAMDGKKIDKKSLEEFYKKLDVKLGSNFNQNEAEVKKVIEGIAGKDNASKISS